MRYKPDISKYQYPDKTDQHMITVKHLVNTHFDESHRYYNKTFGYKLLRFFTNILLHIFIYPLFFFRYGVKIEGRENVKAARKLNKSVMTICNHVFMWDYMGVSMAIRPKMEYFFAWPINFEGPNRHFIKLMGGVPIPQKIKAMTNFSKAIEDIANDGEWIHVYPEGSMWWYYPYIRPLKKGCFKYAYKLDLPVLPMAYSYRKRKGFFALYDKKAPLLTLRIGKPIYINKDLPKNEAIKDIQKRCYHEMQILAGINVDDPDYCTLENYHLLHPNDK